MAAGTESWQMWSNAHHYSTAYELQYNGKPELLDETLEEKNLNVYVYSVYQVSK